jgi:hypothetical protein
MVECNSRVEYLKKWIIYVPIIQRIHNHPFIERSGLYLLNCHSFSDIIPALDITSPHFVALIVADFTTETLDDLVRFSQQMIEAGSRYFCAWGEGCRKAHLAFDLACCQFEPGSESVIFTTDHHDDPIEEAIWHLINCAYPDDPYDRDCHATLVICVNKPQLAQTVQLAFADPLEFSEKNGPNVDDQN